MEEQVVMIRQFNQLEQEAVVDHQLQKVVEEEASFLQNYLV